MRTSLAGRGGGGTDDEEEPDTDHSHRQPETGSSRQTGQVSASLACKRWLTRKEEGGNDG